MYFSLTSFLPETVDEEHVETIDTEDAKEPKISKQSVEHVAREEVVSRTLAAYIEVCAATRAPQRGLNAFHFYRSRFKKLSDKVFSPITDINIYNALLKGFAAKGAFNKVQEILKYATEEGVELNVQSYAAILECLGRIDIDNNYLRFIRIFSKEAKWKGITYDMIMNEVLFMNDQREMVLKAMQSHDRNYEPTYLFPQLQYCNHLLDHLNCDEQLKFSEPKRVESGVFDGFKWNDLVNKQVQIETEGFVTVSSLQHVVF